MAGGTETRDRHALAAGDLSGVTANNLAFAYATRGTRLDRALELSLDAVRRMPATAEPMDTLGFVFLKMRQYTAAADAFATTFALDLAGSRLTPDEARCAEDLRITRFVNDEWNLRL